MSQNCSAAAVSPSPHIRKDLLFQVWAQVLPVSAAAAVVVVVVVVVDMVEDNSVRHSRSGLVPLVAGIVVAVVAVVVRTGRSSPGRRHTLRWCRRRVQPCWEAVDLEVAAEPGG